MTLSIQNEVITKTIKRIKFRQLSLTRIIIDLSNSNLNIYICEIFSIFICNFDIKRIHDIINMMQQHLILVKVYCNLLNYHFY